MALVVVDFDRLPFDELAAVSRQARWRRYLGSAGGRNAVFSGYSSSRSLPRTRRAGGKLTAVRVDSWDDHANGSPLGSRSDAHLTAQLPYPRHHPLNANAQGKDILIAACRRHAPAVILDRYVEQIVFPCKIDTHGRLPRRAYAHWSRLLEQHEA